MALESSIEPFQHRARTKIVATIGPACRDPEQLARLVGAGVDVFRINMAHGTPEEHDSTIQDIRAVSRAGKRPIGILVDLAGPKIRLGQLCNDPTDCHVGARFRFTRAESASHADELTSTYAQLVDELDLNDRVLLADGTVSMIVTKKTADEVHCLVTGPGSIRSRQGINLPGANLSVPALSETDIENALWAARSGVDFVSLSFVRAAAEVRRLKRMILDERSRAKTVAKIEKPEALENLDEIVQAADGVMVARGDLGVEIDVARMPFEQKRIIDTCRKLRRPVIVATQMLDSMQRSSRPTRAEVTDVANAILDGADACMLSGETAIGKFPCESVEMMNRIMLASEEMSRERIRELDFHSITDCVHPTTSSVVYGAGKIAEHLKASMVVIATRSGATALAKAKNRDFIPTVAVSDSEETLRQMTLYWGINPLENAPMSANDDLISFIDEWGRDNQCLATGDKVVIVTGTGMMQGVHNLVMVHEVKGD